MIPVVETQGPDRRRNRKIGWKEARLCLSRAGNCVSPIFGATLGGPDQAGDRLLCSAIGAGLGTDTQVHAVGDGASWIANQVSLVFGVQGSFLVDFYHLCDYLSAAGELCARGQEPRWMEQQKERLRQNRTQEVLDALEPHLEPVTISSDEAPVRACYRYITNRPGQFDYKGALDQGLPIGSGEIESAHRYVVQDRLKIAGAWWKEENARSMLALRVLRANNGWNSYWSSLSSQKAA